MLEIGFTNKYYTLWDIHATATKDNNANNKKPLVNVNDFKVVP